MSKKQNYIAQLKKIKVKGGGEIVFDEVVWIFKGAGINIRFDFLKLDIDQNLMSGIKCTLAWYLENQALSYANSIFNKLIHFVRSINKSGLHEISAIEIINYRASLKESQQWYLGALSGFFRKIYESGYDGINKSAIKLLDEIRIKGNKRGEAVLTSDPVVGPFTELETQSLFREVKNKYHSGELSLMEFSLLWLLLAFGMRNIQYALMKVSDVLHIKDDDGSDSYIIRIPRAKKRVNARNSFIERRLDPIPGALVNKYALEVRENFKDKLLSADNLPLFPGKFQEGQLKEFEGHKTAGQIGGAVCRLSNKLGVISERTGKVLNVTGIRFRRTLGTRAAEEGHSPLTIATILDHEDTQSVGFYIEATSTMIDKIDKALAFKMAPLAQAFKGRLIAGASEATRGGDPRSLIRSPKVNSNLQPMGNCGEFGFCNLMAPIACYTCSNFQPWLDGPHENILNFLLAERERLSLGGDYRIASINDQVILAVSQVILLCNKQLGYTNE